MKLFSNEYSSAASRVRIALALKGLSIETQLIGIHGEGAENRQPDYLKVNPQGLVPALLTDDGTLITQSLSIIEYVDDICPDPSLLPTDPEDRAIARSIAFSIAAEIHALLPPRIAARLKSQFMSGPDATGAWNKYWMLEGLTAVEALMARRPTCRLAATDAPTIADIFLYPQAVNAERAGITLSQWPTISKVMDQLHTIAAFPDNAPAVRK